MAGNSRTLCPSYGSKQAKVGTEWELRWLLKTAPWQNVPPDKFCFSPFFILCMFHARFLQNPSSLTFNSGCDWILCILWALFCSFDSLSWVNQFPSSALAAAGCPPGAPPIPLLQTSAAGQGLSCAVEACHAKICACVAAYDTMWLCKRTEPCLWSGDIFRLWSAEWLDLASG